MNNIILGSLKDYLGVLEKGAWAVSSYLTQVSLMIPFGKSVICVYGLKYYDVIVWVTWNVTYM